ncbi:hypothetical protein ACIBL3_39290 [Kribbella sp. NPDC050124]|uniref:hypothetical protein n=1 Tax=Kribbella sp. NPDC050124 TaxID=3364114 RepID=UPI00379168FF
MRTPLSLFHARFSTELELPIGGSRVPDPDRLRADLKMHEASDGHADVEIHRIRLFCPAY